MKKTICAIATTLLLASATNAQEVPTIPPPDTLANSVTKLQNEINSLKKLKIIGWTQVQFQIADQTGIETYAGGSNFNANVDKRFSVRRGRIKFVYDNGLSLCNLQIDVSERNVQLREFFAKLTDPWLKTFSLTTGMFNRPFGHEISFSSSLRESPERARWEQTLFFNERDLGTWLTVQAPNSSPLHFLKLDAAMVSGTGIANVNNLGASVADTRNNTQNNTSGGNDFDFQKDFIGRISAEKSSANQKITISGGASYYDGGYRTGNDSIYRNEGKGFVLNASSSNKGSIVHRIHYGADFQLSLGLPFGTTVLRAEYVSGQMPGLGFRTYNSVPYSQPITPIYIRNFEGANFYFVQKILQTKHQFVVKYDWYDPNTKISGGDIGAKGSNTTTTDVRFDTWGLGWLYYWDANVKLSAYYDLASNEKTLITNADPRKDFSKDIKDNVVTLRIQYKF